MDLTAPPAYIGVFRREQFQQGLLLLLAALSIRTAAESFAASAGVGEALSFVFTVLPTAAHVAAASLLALSIVRWSRSTPFLTCALFSAVAVGLECLEHAAVHGWAMAHAPLWALTAANELVSSRQVGVTRGFHIAEVCAAMAGGLTALIYVRVRWFRIHDGAHRL